MIYRQNFLTLKACFVYNATITFFSARIHLYGLIFCPDNKYVSWMCDCRTCKHYSLRRITVFWIICDAYTSNDYGLWVSGSQMYMNLTRMAIQNSEYESCRHWESVLKKFSEGRDDEYGIVRMKEERGSRTREERNGGENASLRCRRGAEAEME